MRSHHERRSKVSALVQTRKSVGNWPYSRGVAGRSSVGKGRDLETPRVTIHTSFVRAGTAQHSRPFVKEKNLTYNQKMCVCHRGCCSGPRATTTNRAIVVPGDA